jgi:hypothetical protein
MAIDPGRAVAHTERGGTLATQSATPLIDQFAILDVYAGGISAEPPRVESLATISAGYRGKPRGDRPGIPERSTDGTIHLHDGTGRAPGLRRALDTTGGKRLTIAFPFDDPSRFIHCRFMRYSATELLAFGDETHLMVLVPGQGYRRVEAGTEGYAREVAASKVSVSVYFCLAEWGADGPEIVFPDGVGAYYRLRFTSRHSLRSILAGLRSIGQFTQGRIAGVPFDLTIDYREVADATGKKRTIPVWSIATKPPGGRRLTSRNFNDVMTMALAQGAALMLPPPPEPTLEEALAEGPDPDLDDAIVEGVVVGEPSDRDLALIERGGRCDERRWRAMFFSAVRGTDFDGDESPARAAWLWEYTKQQTDSLSDFLHWATEREAQAMVVAADDELKRRRADREERGESPPARPAAHPKRSYQDLFPDDDAAPPQQPDAARPATTVTRRVDAAARLTGAPARPAPATSEVDDGDIEPEPDPETGEQVSTEPPPPTEAQRIVAGAVEEPATFPRRRADDWYARLAAVAAERGHPKAARINAKKAGELDYRPLVEAIRVLLTYFPDVTVEQLDGASEPAAS